MEIKLTDDELVEAVAREVLGLSQTNGSYWYLSDTTISRMRIWNPLTDLNDLFMVLDSKKFHIWTWETDEFIGFSCAITIKNIQYIKGADTLPRAVLEARLIAERSEKC